MDSCGKLVLYKRKAPNALDCLHESAYGDEQSSRVHVPLKKARICSEQDEQRQEHKIACSITYPISISTFPSSKRPESSATAASTCSHSTPLIGSSDLAVVVQVVPNRPTDVCDSKTIAVTAAPRLTESQRRSLVAFRDDLRALSIKQPAAWAIINGFKKVENRSWSLNLEQDGKWFVLHASGQAMKATDGLVRRIDVQSNGTILPLGVCLADLCKSAPRSVLLGLAVCGAYAFCVCVCTRRVNWIVVCVSIFQKSPLTALMRLHPFGTVAHFVGNWTM